LKSTEEQYWHFKNFGEYLVTWPDLVAQRGYEARRWQNAKIG
jgi:hypothetical protein